jgi:spermidine/putrescine transport system substrate-binding protein
MAHPRERRGLDRRDFLRRGAGATLGLSGIGALLAACGNQTGAPAAEPSPPATTAEPGLTTPATTAETPGGTTTAPATTAASDLPFPLARPESPVTLPIVDDNPVIESGLEPEAGPLKIYNWIDYIWKRKLKDFGKEYGVEVELATFYTMDQAIAKLATGQTDYDVFFPTPDRLSRLAYGKVLRPLNLDYIPNLQNMWPVFASPFYDQGAQYSVPYTIYTTGIAYRRDKVKTDPFELANGYEILWDPAYKGKAFVLDDSREAPAMVLLKNGITDINTEDPALINMAKEELLSLIDLVNVKTSIEDYTKIPEGSAWVHQGWSGDMLAGSWYLPEGTEPDVLGYWYPPEGGGVIGNDLISVLAGGKNPVLAHHFLNFMLDEKNALDNMYNYNGYQPPLTSVTADSLIADGFIPENLVAAAVRQEDFEKAYLLLELSPDGQALWQNAWAEFKAGV